MAVARVESIFCWPRTREDFLWEECFPVALLEDFFAPVDVLDEWCFGADVDDVFVAVVDLPDDVAAESC
jgi:hypothetical protein